MNNIEQIKKQNLETACRTVARKTGKAHSVVSREKTSEIVETSTVKDTDVVTYEHTGRI